MSNRPPLLSVDHALTLILADVQPLNGEEVPLEETLRRVLAKDVSAQRTQPPFAASAMDGYAIRHADLDRYSHLTCVGEAAAGHGYGKTIGPGECVRIFTGAPVPEGADTILIQEDARADGRAVDVLEAPTLGRYVRPAGLDFSKGDVLLQAGRALSPADISLAAAMDYLCLPVRRRPTVAIISTGDELVPPGTPREPDQIVSSNGYGLTALVSEFGGAPRDLGIVEDQLPSLQHAFDSAQDADIVVTLGGASVGDHDLVQQALQDREVTPSFWKLAMRPGKPMMFGTKTRDDGTVQRFMGLPGNPVSSLVCAIVFLKPLVRGLLGLPTGTPFEPALLGKTIAPNDQREEYMRAKIQIRDGKEYVIPFDRQDSSILSLMSKAHCLVRRPAHSPEMKSGDPCQIIRLRSHF